MNGFLKLLGAIEVMREAFDDSKHPTFSASYEFRLNDSESNDDGDGCFYVSSPSSSSTSSSCHHWSGGDDGEAAEEDDSSDSTAGTLITCIRLGRVLKLVDRGSISQLAKGRRVKNEALPIAVHGCSWVGRERRDNDSQDDYTICRLAVVFWHPWAS